MKLIYKRRLLPKRFSHGFVKEGFVCGYVSFVVTRRRLSC